MSYCKISDKRVINDIRDMGYMGNKDKMVHKGDMGYKGYIGYKGDKGDIKNKDYSVIGKA